MFFETFKLISTGLVIESVVKDKCPSQWKRILTRVACLVIVGVRVGLKSEF